MSGVFDHVRGANVVIDRELRLAECVVVHGRRREVGAWEGGHTPCGQNGILQMFRSFCPVPVFSVCSVGCDWELLSPVKGSAISVAKKARELKNPTPPPVRLSWPLASPISYSQHREFARKTR